MPAIGTNMQFESEAANFGRDQFATLAEMKAYTICDEGHLSWCKETKKRYSFDKTNTFDDTTGYWRVFEMNVDSIRKTISMTEDEWDSLKNNKASFDAFCIQYSGWDLDVLGEVVTSFRGFGSYFGFIFG